MNTERVGRGGEYIFKERKRRGGINEDGGGGLIGRRYI